MSDTKEWKGIPDGIKGIIVKQMDSESRPCLTIFSKANKQVVDSIPFEVEEIIVVECDDNIALQFGALNIKNCKNGDVHISSTDCTKRRMIRFSNGDVAKKFVMGIFVQTMLYGHIRSEAITISCSFPEMFEDVGFKLSAPIVHINSIDTSNTMKWLQNLNPCVETIVVESKSDRFEVHKDIGTIPEIINAKNLTIHKLNDINDEQVVNFKAKQLYLGHSNVTEKGLNMLMKKWIMERYTIGSTISIPIFDVDFDMLFNGLDYETIDGPICDLNGRIVIDNKKELIIKMENYSSGTFTAEVCPIREHKLTNWSNLPNEIKCMIIERMNDKTRDQLKLCSKSDKCLVESMFSCLTKVKISRGSVACSDEAGANWLKLDHCSNANQHHILIQLNHKRQKIAKPDASAADYWMVLATEMILSRNGIRFDEFRWLMYISANVQSRKLLKIRVKDISFLPGISNRDVLKYLKLAPCPAEKVYVHTLPVDILPTDSSIRIGALPVIKQAKELKIYGDYGITDKQILSFESTKMQLSPAKVTEKGVNRLIWKMINKGYPIGTAITIGTTNISDFKQSLVNLKHKKYRWESSYKSVGIYMRGSKQMTAIYEKKESGNVLKINIREKMFKKKLG